MRARRSMPAAQSDDVATTAKGAPPAETAMDPQEAAEASDSGITPALEQDDPASDPGPQNRPVVPGTMRPISRLQAEDPQLHEGPIERPPYEAAADGDTMGIEHILLALNDLNFPVSREDLLEQAGDWRIPTTGRHFHRLRDYLADVRGDSFRSPTDVARAIAKAHPDLRR